MSFCLILLYCSWGSCGKNICVVCHSLLQWTMFCQNSLLWLIHLGWCCIAWLIASLSYANAFARTRLRFMKGITSIKHTATAKSLQSCPTLCDPVDGSPLGSLIPGILQARTLEWIAISFSSAWKWKVKVKSLSRVRPSATPWTAAFHKPLLKRVRRWEERVLMAWDCSRGQQGEETLLSWLDSVNGKPWTLLPEEEALQLPFPSVKAFSFSCVGTCMWLTMVTDPNSQFSSEPKQNNPSLLFSC